jgi:vacuolar-type H+-ATPase subunit E/Vma4
MAEELKDLIEKIQEEGVKAGEEKARKIEADAKKQASAIIERAKKEAARTAEEAVGRAADAEASGRAVLKQAGRDLILSLKKEICATLDRIVASHAHKALEPAEMTRIIATLVKEHAAEAESDIVISFKKEDLEKLEKGLLSELRAEVKKGLILKTSDEIQGGFIISYDAGKSYYDFTDKALARYIAASLRPKLAEILDEGS